MFAELGIITTALALLCAVFATLGSAYGALNQRERWILSARNAALLIWPLLTTAVLTMLAAQYSGDFSIQYVYNVTNSTEPLFYKMTALWGGQPGSLLFWAWTMSTFTCAALLLNWKSDRRLMPWVVTFTALVLSFFLILVVVFENPFQRFWTIPGQQEVINAVFQPAFATVFRPTDGRGLNPLLRHPGMVIHPPMLYAGYVGMTIPWAFAMAALASGQLNTNWIKVTRRWILLAWLLLGLGLILGGRWAYDVLGWGGYWGWDPVENAALLPWLTGTAFLHSVMIQEKRGMLKVWNMFLIILTFLLVMLGTFATRSGIVSSVHSFAQSSIGVPMLIFVAGTILGCLGLWGWRWSRGDLASDHQLDALISRESMFVLNNWIFVGITIMVLWGTYAPVFSELFTGQQITLGREYYLGVVVPLFGAMFLLMGVAPLVAWKKSSVGTLNKQLQLPLVLTVATIAFLFATGTRNGTALLAYGLVFFAGYTTILEYYRGVRARMSKGENPITALVRLFARSRQRYGGYFIHLGIVVIGIGVIASTVFQMETQATIGKGDQITLGNMTMVYENAYQADADDGRLMVMADVGVYKDGVKVADIRPRKDFFGTESGSQMPMTIAGQYTTLESDFYVLLTGWEGQRLTFHVYINPLVNLVWWGGIILILGTIIAAWPSPQKDTVAKLAEKTAPGQLQLAGD
ncbi:MAG: heme lyase CcmF/NrfE family subunit [Anaerolineae bacterium]|nr:heme lyase CcmF/NrfE family subunit [Anaerolineae bacterium]